MIRLLPLIGSLLLVPVAARAGDFTGFYAGVNAGYGWDREAARGSGPAAFPPGSAAPDGAGPNLPPSASAAAASLRRAGAGRPAPGR